MKSSRHVPFTQQPYCCVAASLQAVMYRQGIPLMEQETLAYELGLTVPEEDAHLFNKVYTGEKPSSGWGTQIQLDKYEINKIFKRLEIPLRVTFYKTDVVSSPKKLLQMLRQIESEDSDALLCFDYGKLWNLDRRGGHFCVFDYVEDEGVWLVDPIPNVPKHRKVTVEQLYEAIDIHGDNNGCGIWKIESLSIH